VRMMRHGRAPGVEHGRDADARAEMPRVGGDGHHRLGRCLEQQVVNHRLVVECDVGDLGRQREDDMEVADRQQIGLPCGKPLACCGALALGAVPISAANVQCTLAALWANLVMGSQRRLLVEFRPFSSAMALLRIVVLSP